MRNHAEKSRGCHSNHQGRYVSRELYLIVALFVGIVLSLLLISQFQAYLLDSVRAYVAGEGHWSKGQKDAVFHLSTYAANREEAEYRRFLEGIDVILGDRRARNALQQPRPDRAAAREGFLAGGNHPEDVDNLITFFLYFQNLQHMRSAIAIWERGDEKIDQLRKLGMELHEEIGAGGSDSGRIRDILQRVNSLSRELSILENRFSATLGEAARWGRGVTRNAVFLSVFLLLAGGLFLTWRIARTVRRTEQSLIESEARFRHVVESNILGFMFWRADGAVVDANDVFLKSIGSSREELEAGRLNWREMTAPEFRQDDENAFREIEREGVCTPYEKEFIGKDGRRVAVYVGSARLSGKGSSEGISFALDVTRRRESERMQRLAAAVFSATTEGIVVVDRRRRIEAVNPAFTRITGYEADEVIGENPGILSSGLHDRLFYLTLWRELEESGHWRGEIWNKRKSGEIYPEMLTINAIRDESGDTIQYVGIFSDITERKEQERAIWHQAHHDTLTDLPNRALFHDRLAQHLAMARRDETKVAVLFFDLDRFKQVNDTLGHHAGDTLLQEVARRIAASVRESDTLARVSGDEFTVSLHSLKQAEDARHVAEKILTACSQPITIMGQEVTISVSIGIALYPDDADTLEELMQHADAAMYASKQAGRNTFRYYGAQDKESA
jgi:diguanylate cyclase (GGDEF)-like protein/PAS domain S-box-containing protein